MSPRAALSIAFIEEFFHPLAAVVPAESVVLRGQWSESQRLVYASEEQLGSGARPFVEVIDAQWAGTLESPSMLTGLAVVSAPDGSTWVKADRAKVGAELGLSLTRGTGDGRATFTQTFHGAYLPGRAVECRVDLLSTCRPESSLATTGRPHLVAEIDGAAFVLVLLPGSALKVGRNRLWRLRDELADGLPVDLRTVMTRARTGSLRP